MKIVYKILAALSGLLIAWGLKLRGDKFKAKQEKAEMERDQYGEVLDDVRMAKEARESLNDPDVYDRVRDEFTRK